MIQAPENLAVADGDPVKTEHIATAFRQGHLHAHLHAMSRRSLASKHNHLRRDARGHSYNRTISSHPISVSASEHRWVLAVSSAIESERAHLSSRAGRRHQSDLHNLGSGEECSSQGNPRTSG
jgi:hypothetical protein